MKTMKTLPVPNHSRALAPVSFRSAAPARARQDPVSGRAGSPGPRFASWLVLLLLACLLQTHAGSLVWTNASGGTWGNPANWSPNQVPSPTDDAVIGADGTLCRHVGCGRRGSQSELGRTAVVIATNGVMNINGSMFLQNAL